MSERAWTIEAAPTGASALKVAVLTYDLPGRDVNVLTEASLGELDERLDELQTSEWDAVLVRSGKPGSFIAGADIAAIESVTDADEGRQKAAFGQRVLRRLAKLGRPTVALIDGACVGGGAELACWCTGRVASRGDRTRIGFPEVRLGIVPGFGGTQSVPGLVGFAPALGLVTTGRLLGPRQARRVGIVDAVVHADLLVAEGAALAATLRKRRRSPRRHWSNLPGTRDVVVAQALRRIEQATSGRYPAPPEAVRLCRRALDREPTEGLREEAETLGELVVTPVSRNLVRTYQLSRAAGKGAPEPDSGALVGVVGAGVMGAGIAGVALASGHRARLRDVDPGALGRGVAAVDATVRRARRQAWDRRLSARTALDRFSYGLTLDGLHPAALAIEAVVENPDIKRTVLTELEQAVGQDCVIATNTSSLSVGELAGALQQPERFVGLHFFNPVPRMPLVEVVPGPSTSPDVIERAVGFVRSFGKHPVVVADSPGFLVNRLLMPYLAEAFELLGEKVGAVRIDAAAREFGMPMGPFEVLDEVGLDVARHVSRTFAEAFPNRFPENELIATLVDGGRLGKKAGKGFYNYRKGRRRAPWRKLPRARVEVSPATIQDRLFLRMADEAYRCLDEGVAGSADDVDLATIFGIGFPPFRGGLCRWVAESGPTELLARMHVLHERLGDRLEPSSAFAAAVLRSGE